MKQMRIPERVKRQSLYLYKGQQFEFGLVEEEINDGGRSMNTKTIQKVKWERTYKQPEYLLTQEEQLQLRKINSENKNKRTQRMKKVYEAQTVHLEGQKYFSCGGWVSAKLLQRCETVADAVIIDKQIGIIKRCKSMMYSRDNHRICKVGNFIYICGGEFKSAEHEWTIYKSNERYNISANRWQQDVPDFSEAKKNFSMMIVDNTWIYTFGGANFDNQKQQNQLVERLNTLWLHDDEQLNLTRRRKSQWQSIAVKSPGLLRVSLHGCIQLNATCDSQRRFFIFGGRHHQTFIINEDKNDFSNQQIELINAKSKKDLAHPIKDFFYHQLEMKVTQLPEDMRNKPWLFLKNVPIAFLKKEVFANKQSENLILFPGYFGLHIFDIDNEYWIIDSNRAGHKIEELKRQVDWMKDQADEEEGIVI